MISGDGTLSGEDAGKNASMTTKDLKYYINLIDKASTGFEKTNSNCEKKFSSGLNTIISIACYR